jgi:hypothetical protein
MKLIYRGLTFDYDWDAGGHPVQSSPLLQSSYALIYRGNTYWVDPSAIAPASVRPITQQLFYRGMSYVIRRHVPREFTAGALYHPLL